MAKLNENISKIEKGSDLDTLYNRLLSGFQAMQNEPPTDYTSSDYITETVDEEGFPVYVADEAKITASVSEQRGISMQNAAYLLASSMINGNPEGGGSGEIPEGGSGGLFVSIAGDYMTGKLNTLYGFSAGDAGLKILEVYRTLEEGVSQRKNIVDINGELHLGAHGLFINGSNVISYDNDELILQAPLIKLVDTVEISKSLTVDGWTIDKNGINNGDYVFYHSGNANLSTVDWSMKDGFVYGNLTVNDTSTLKGKLSALYDFELGKDGEALLFIDENGSINFKSYLDTWLGYKIRGLDVLHYNSEQVISLSAPDRYLNLGDDGTLKIVLQTGIYDDDGEYELVGKFGDAYFPNSFRAGHLLGNVLIETYKNDTEDAGVVVNRWLKFNDIFGPGLFSDGNLLKFKSPFRYVDIEDETQITDYRYMDMEFIESDSLFAPLNRKSASLFLTTDADFYVFNKPIEGKISLGIAKSKTRLLDNQLFFDDSIYWQGLTDGVKYYGNAYMVNDIGSVEFSSGFAGSGWQIYKNQLTGNISATFDELTVRKKMRLYELEVQKQSVTNGSLWVSDACSGDLVEEIV